MRQHSDLRSAMRPKLLAMTALAAGAASTATLFAHSLSSISSLAQTRPRYLPDYTASGDLILGENSTTGGFVGSGGSSALSMPKQRAPIL